GARRADRGPVGAGPQQELLTATVHPPRDVHGAGPQHGGVALQCEERVGHEPGSYSGAGDQPSGRSTAQACSASSRVAGASTVPPSNCWPACEPTTTPPAAATIGMRATMSYALSSDSTTTSTRPAASMQ